MKNVACKLVSKCSTASNERKSMSDNYTKHKKNKYKN